MDSNQAIRQVVVEAFYPNRKGLGLLDRLAANTSGKWPKLKLHKLTCPCCDTVRGHRA